MKAKLSELCYSHMHFIALYIYCILTTVTFLFESIYLEKSKMNLILTSEISTSSFNNIIYKRKQNHTTSLNIIHIKFEMESKLNGDFCLSLLLLRIILMINDPNNF